MHTSHYTVNRVVQNSAQGYSDNFGSLLSRCSVVCSASKGCDCSRIAKFLAVANLCRDHLAASGILRLSAIYEHRLRRFTSARRSERLRAVVRGLRSFLPLLTCAATMLRLAAFCGFRLFTSTGFRDNVMCQVFK